ncbi:MAG: DUF3617 family protein [Gallionellaceae bacterium]
MKRILLKMAALSFTMYVSTVLAATGEWWEVTGKMEMEGMGFAMPAQTSKVCMPKGGESDPRYTQGNNSNCKMTDVKHSGNTVKFKGTCVTNGETMNVAGETSHSGSSFKSNVKMTGKSQGEAMNMSMVSSGKKIGGSCDTEEMGRKAKAQLDAGMEKACDTSKYETVSWVHSSEMFIGAKPPCPGKKEALCKVLRNDVPKDLNAYQALEQMEKEKNKPSAAKACNVNLATMKNSLCKTRAKRGPLSFLEANCPAEAKSYRELLRKREECEGRGFTSGAKMKQCMGGQLVEDESESAPPAKSRRAKAEQEESASGENTSEAVREGAKALKGLFGF